jgi:threonine dehydrogenase-like Zn-dependent dehydrogenase
MNARALVMLAPRSFEVRELRVPDTPPAGGAILRILANGICGSDWDLYSGKLTRTLRGPIPWPVVPGHEPVGRIVAIDPAAAEAWKVAEGDRVVVESRIRCGECRECVEGRLSACRNALTYSLISVDEAPGLWGGMAEYMLVLPRSSVFKVPEHLSDADAGLCNPFGNAFSWTLQAARVGVGDRVLVLGPGQRGLACTVAAHEAGAAQIIVTGLSRDAHKLALAPEFGASAVINVEQEDTVERVRELTDGEGVDVVIDAVPEDATPIVHALEAARVGGTIVVAGVRASPAEEFPVGRITGRQLHLIGVSATTPWSVSNALRVLAEGRYPFHKLHSHSVGLEGVEDAVRILGGEVEGAPIHMTVVP